MEVSILLPPAMASTGAVAQVAGDDLQGFNGLAQNFGGALGHIGVGRAVETVAADMIVDVILIGDGIGVSAGGMVWWNAVSNTATMGTPGITLRKP